MNPKREFMQEAIRLAEIARREGDYAIGAVLVKNDKIIAAATNRSKRDENPIAHAETLAILEAAKLLKTRHLIDCILYTTHEPCPMCAAVAVWAKLSGIVYGAGTEDMKNYQVNHSNEYYNWRTIDIACKEVIKRSPEKIEIISGFMREECLELFHND